MNSIYTDIDDEVRKTLFEKFLINATIIGGQRQEKAKRENNSNIPWAILMDPTSTCNLHCTGCWAADYGNQLSISYDLFQENYYQKYLRIVHKYRKNYFARRTDMGLSVKTRKLLWGNAANMCSFSNCRKRLVIDKTLTDDVSIVGEECHIVAKSENGPRGKSEITQDERDKYDNLILLCNVHHKIIDDQINQYSVDVLKEMKFTHEKWVESTLNVDKSKHNIDLYYADIIDNWEQMADLDDWKGWTSNVLFGGQPSILISKMDQLVELNEWLFNRILPKKYLELEDSLENFRRILNDFIQTFKKYKIERGNLYETEKIYKRLNYWDPDKYSLLSKEFDFHIDLVQDLVIELTRAANFVCDKVRKYLLYNYRLDKGILLIMGGPYSDMSFRTYRVEYSTDLEGIPYKNLESFKIDRENRDLHFGRGTKWIGYT